MLISNNLDFTKPWRPQNIDIAEGLEIVDPPLAPRALFADEAGQIVSILFYFKVASRGFTFMQCY